MEENIQIRPAQPDDRLSVETLLQACKLPLQGVQEHFANFFVADSGRITRCRVEDNVLVSSSGDAAAQEAK